MKKLSILVSFLFILILLIGCTKKIPDRYIVPKTQEGRGTIGYFMGDLMIVGGTLTLTDTIFRRADGGVSLAHYAQYSEQPMSASLLLEFDFDTITKGYVFGNARFKLFETGPYNGYLDSVSPGFVNINYQSSSIIAGEFELNFQLIDSVFVSDTLYEVVVQQLDPISKGRFDIQY